MITAIILNYDRTSIEAWTHDREGQPFFARLQMISDPDSQPFREPRHLLHGRRMHRPRAMLVAASARRAEGDRRLDEFPEALRTGWRADATALESAASGAVPTRGLKRGR